MKKIIYQALLGLAIGAFALVDLYRSHALREDTVYPEPEAAKYNVATKADFHEDGFVTELNYAVIPDLQVGKKARLFAMNSEGILLSEAEIAGSQPIAIEVNAKKGDKIRYTLDRWLESGKYLEFNIGEKEKSDNKFGRLIVLNLNQDNPSHNPSLIAH